MTARARPDAARTIEVVRATPERWPDVAVEASHPSLAGVDERDLLGALVESCGAEILTPERCG